MSNRNRSFEIVQLIAWGAKWCVPLGIVLCLVVGCSPKPASKQEGTSPENTSSPPSTGEQNEASRVPDNTIASLSPEKKESNPASGPTTPQASSAAPPEGAVPLAVDGTASEAKLLIEQCIATYQNASSYQDEGVLRVELPAPPGDNGTGSGSSNLETTPLRVAWERPNKLAIRTTQISSGWTEQTFESIAGDSNSERGVPRPFDNQRLVRPRPDQITWSWLMEDHLSNVLEKRGIGIPLSLELLLAGNPLSDWLNPEQAQLRLGETDIFDRIPCRKVEVAQAQGRFVLWIDEARKLILRCELPSEPYFQIEKTEDSKDRPDPLFSIDLVNAQVNTPVDWSKWSLPRSGEEVLVRRFINPPPRILPPQLATLPQPTVLKDQNGKEILDTSQRRTPITLLHWIDNSLAGREFVDDLVKFQKELEANQLKAYVETQLVTQIPEEQIKQALAEWNCGLPVAIDTSGELAKRCGVNFLYTTVILGKDGTIQSIDRFTDFPVLFRKVEQLHQGIDIATRMRKDAVDDEARYASRLHRNVINRSQVSNLSVMHQTIPHFPLSFYEMEMEWRSPLDNSTVSGTGESFPPYSASNAIPGYEVFAKPENQYRVASLLDDLGNVIVVDQTGKRTTVATIPIQQATDAVRIHVLPDPWSHNFVAIVPEGLPRFWYAVAPHILKGDFAAQEATQTPLEPGESVLTATWVNKEGNSRLWLTTDQGRYLEIDPGNQRMDVRKVDAASGRAQMVNIVPSINDRAEFVGWNGIWSDQAIENLPWLEEGSGAKPKLPTKLPFKPEYGNWVWGRGREKAYLVGLEKFASGETGAILMDSNFTPLMRQALSVLPEQCKLLAATQTKENRFYWLATAPNRVLHLQTLEGYPDQMSFGQRIYGATLLPGGDSDEDDLKLIVILEKEVSCWKVKPR